MTTPVREQYREQYREHYPEYYDAWLDELSAPTQPALGRVATRVIGWFSGPARLARRMLSFLSTTPGKMTALMVILTLAIAAAGMSLAQSSSLRHERLNVLLTATEPMNNAAHNLYTSLSVANTVSSTSFVQSGAVTELSRQAYDAAVDNAAITATQSVLGTDKSDTEIRDLVLLIQRQLPVYTGMVEQARAHHRAGHAVAVNYLTNASALMREEILPAAGKLFQLTSAKVVQQQRAQTAPQLVSLSGFIAAAIMLVLAQWWLRRLSRRRFNRGFLTGTALMLIALVWVVTANAVTWSAGAHRFDAAATPWEQLATAQITAQQARTAETLLLVNRQTPNATANDFVAMMNYVRQALKSFEAAAEISPAQAMAVSQARTALNEWSVSHDRLVEDLGSGAYDDAIYEATGLSAAVGQPTQPTAARAFNTLNDTLTALISTTREVMRSNIYDSREANFALGGGVGLLTVLAIIAIWMGIRPRLQEYL